MSYTVNEVLNLIDKITDSFKPIYDLIISGGTSYTAIHDAETQVLEYDTYDKEYPLLYGMHQTVLKLGSDKVPTLYRDVSTSINTALSGVNSWLTDNNERISTLENLIFKSNSIVVNATNIFPDGDQNMFTLDGTVLDVPTNVSLTAGTDSGSFSDGTYYVTVTALNECGETLQSAEASITLSGGTSTQSINVSWDAVTGATGYKIYEDATSGTEKYSDSSTSNLYTILDPATGDAPPAISTAHNWTDGVTIDTTSTGAAIVNYKVTTQGANDILLTIYETLEDDSTTTEDITVTGGSAAGTTFSLVNKVKDITQISISSATPGQATDSGTIITVADR